jgi:hypothetical protein
MRNIKRKKYLIPLEKASSKGFRNQSFEGAFLRIAGK